MQNKLRFKNIIAIFCFGLLLTSCASFSGQLSYFDENTYDNLTKLKPRVSLLYQSFGEAKLDLSEIRTIRLLLAQAHEYEKGKGSGNVAIREKSCNF